MIEIAAAAVDVGTGEIEAVYERPHLPGMKVTDLIEQCKMQAEAVDYVLHAQGLCGVIIARADKGPWGLLEDYIDAA